MILKIFLSLLILSAFFMLIVLTSIYILNNMRGTKLWKFVNKHIIADEDDYLK